MNNNKNKLRLILLEEALLSKNDTGTNIFDCILFLIFRSQYITGGHPPPSSTALQALPYPNFSQSAVQVPSEGGISSASPFSHPPIAPSQAGVSGHSHYTYDPTILLCLCVTSTLQHY